MTKKITLIILFLIYINAISAYTTTNESTNIYYFELGTGKSSNNSIFITSIMLGGQLSTFDITVNNTNLEEGLFKIAYSGEETVPVLSGGRISTIHYDVIADVIDDIYYISEKIDIKIIFENKGKEIDSDGKINYFLLKNNKRHLERFEERELIPPGKEILFIEQVLPLNAKLGEWHFCVEWETRVQGKIISCDAFQVTDDISVLIKKRLVNIIFYFGVIILTMILAILFIGFIRRKDIKNIFPFLR